MSGRSFMRGSLTLKPEFDSCLSPILTLEDSWSNLDNPTLNKELGVVLLKNAPQGMFMPGGLISRPPKGWSFDKFSKDGLYYEFVVGFKDELGVQGAFISLLPFIADTFYVERDLTEVELTYDYENTEFGTRVEVIGPDSVDLLNKYKKEVAMTLSLFLFYALTDEELEYVNEEINKQG